MEKERQHVEVEAKFSKEGGMCPLWVVWEDGRKYKIEHVKFVERASVRKDSAMPIRYICLIGGKEKRLYYEPDEMRWFVEPVLVKNIL